MTVRIPTKPSPPCAHSALAEAWFDGRLGAPEQLTMERHLAICPTCRDARYELEVTRASLRALPNDVPPLEHRRARLALLQAAAPVPQRRRRAIPSWLVAGGLVMPVAVWAAASIGVPSRAPSRVEAPAVGPLANPNEARLPPSHGWAAPPEEAPVVNEPAHGGPVPIAPRAVKASPPGGSPEALRTRASRAFAEAMDAVARGDFGAGAALLERFAGEHPKDPRAEEALYLEAIALERAGRIPDARAVARRYIATYPGGAHEAKLQGLAGDD